MSCIWKIGYGSVWNCLQVLVVVWSLFGLDLQHNMNRKGFVLERGIILNLKRDFITHFETRHTLCHGFHGFYDSLRFSMVFMVSMISVRFSMVFMVSMISVRFPWFPYFLCGFHGFCGFYAFLRFPWFPWFP